MDSDESNFNISVGSDGQSHKTVSTNHNFWRERRAEAVSNRGPSAYQPTALPLGQTDSLWRSVYDYSLLWRVFESPSKWCTHLLRYSVVTWLVPREAAAISTHVMCTPYSHVDLVVYSVTPCKATYVRVHVCLAVTCHLHFRQNDRDLLRATAATGMERIPK